ncbi:hypothetical protein WUBG_12592, partial [Wuchereria bancrofti]
MALSTLGTVIGITDKIAAAGQNHLLRTFVIYYFQSTVVKSKLNPDDETVHSALCKHITSHISYIEADNGSLALVFRQLWFLLVVVAKSMVLWLLDIGLYKVPRENRFSRELLFRIEQLIDKVVLLIIAKHREIPQECQLANSAVAYFLRYCFSFLNRGSVFSWIHRTIENMDESCSRTMLDYKLEFLQIISSHEHWIPLCLPLICDVSGNIFRKNSSPSTDKVVFTCIAYPKTHETRERGASFLYSPYLQSRILIPAVCLPIYFRNFFHLRQTVEMGMITVVTVDVRRNSSCPLHIADITFQICLEVDIDQIIPFLPITLNRLFTLLTYSFTDEMALSTL